MKNSKKLLPVKRIFLDFYPSEADLIAQVEKQPRKQTYIKDLIRKDISVSWHDDLMSALRALGVGGDVIFCSVAAYRIEVMVDGEYFGIWDVLRKTFVD
jgi:hypothetical protein